jgi:2'-5' RNA ligase
VDARTFIVIPASDVPVALAEFRQRHIHACAVIPLHTTLVAPFLSLHDLERDGLAQLRQLAASIPPFQYNGGSICTFPTSNVLWLAPTPVAPFEHLTQAIYERFPHLPRGVDYPTYHMTVGLTPTPDEIREVTREFQTTFGTGLPMSFVARELAVYVGLDNNYQLLSTLPLGGA